MCPKRFDMQVVEEPIYSWREEIPEAAYQTFYREPWLAHGVETQKANVKGAPIQDEQRPTTDWEILGTTLKKMGVGAGIGRCTVCHTPGTVQHPQWTGDSHPAEKFSCLACHDGTNFGRDDGFDHNGNRLLKKGLTEMPCGKCHMEASVAGAANLSIGRDLLWKYGCASCHDLDIPKFQNRYAPRLNQIGDRLPPEDLDRWIAHPRAVQANSKMPRVIMEDAERQAIVAFLGTLRKNIPNPPSNDGNSVAGKIMVTPPS